MIIKSSNIKKQSVFCRASSRFSYTASKFQFFCSRFSYFPPLLTFFLCLCINFSISLFRYWLFVFCHILIASSTVITTSPFSVNTRYKNAPAQTVFPCLFRLFFLVQWYSVSHLPSYYITYVTICQGFATLNLFYCNSVLVKH